MTIQNYIKEQKISNDYDLTKIKLLKSVANLLLLQDNESLKKSIKYLAVLANTFHVELKQKKRETVKDINKATLYKVSEIIQNKHGYVELLPETFGLLLLFAKNNNLSLNL